MEPGAVAAAQLGDLGERVDGAGVDGAGRGDHQPRADAGGSVLLQRGGERGGGHAVVGVGGDLAARRAAAPGDVQRLVDAMVGEAAGVDRAAAVLVAGVAGGDDGGQIGDAAARGQRAGGGVGEADDAGQPVGGRHSPAAPRRGWPRRSRNICSTRRRAGRRAPNGTARRRGYRP